MALMKSTNHNIQKKKWQIMIQERIENKLSIKEWCDQNQVSQGSYYYWLKIIREDALVQAGTLAVTACPTFAEITPKPMETNIKSQGICAVVQIKEFILEIHNGADPVTLKTMIQLLNQSC